MEISFLPAEEITPWLPFASSPFFVEDYYGNRLLYPDQIPQMNEYRLLDLAIQRALLRAMLAEKASTPRPTGREKQANKPEDISVPGYVTVAERGIIIEPTLFRYAVDAREVVLVALDSLEPSSTQILRRAGEEERSLCYAICLEGDIAGHKENKETIKITLATGEAKEVVVHTDCIYFLQALPGQDAVIEYQFDKLTINGKKSGSLPIIFGEVGIVIDTRGRPLTLPDVTLPGNERFKRWLAAVAKPVLLT